MKFIFFKSVALISLSVLLLAISFLSDTFWFIGFIGFVPAFFAIEAVDGKKIYVCALFGVLYALALDYPLLSFTTVNSVMLPFRDLILFKTLAASYLGVVGILIGVCLWAAFLAPSFWRLISIPFVWVLFEFLFVWVNSGAEWGLIGETLVASALFRQYAAYGGAYILSGILLFGNVAFFEGLRRNGNGNLFPSVAFGVVVIALLVTGGFALMRVQTLTINTGSDGFFARIAILQSGYKGLWGVYYYEELKQSSRALIPQLSGEKVDLMIIPAAHFGVLTEADVTPELLRDNFGNIFESAEKTLFEFTLLEGGNTYSAMAMIGEDGSRMIHKKRGLFFSDSFPLWLKPFSFLQKYSMQYAVPMSEEKSAVFEFSRGSFGGLVCSESLNPIFSKEAERQGANFLVISGSNSDFKSSFIHREALRIARIRAVQTRMYVVQAMKTGISAIIDPAGNVVMELAKDQRGVLEYSVPIRKQD